jgi:hypothetical protein
LRRRKSKENLRRRRDKRRLNESVSKKRSESRRKRKITKEERRTLKRVSGRYGMALISHVSLILRSHTLDSCIHYQLS